jgi:hypothetical protein
MWLAVIFEDRRPIGMLYGYANLQEGSELGTLGPEPVVFQV